MLKLCRSVRKVAKQKGMQINNKRLPTYWESDRTSNMSKGSLFWAWVQANQIHLLQAWELITPNFSSFGLLYIYRIQNTCKEYAIHNHSHIQYFIDFCFPVTFEVNGFNATYWKSLKLSLRSFWGSIPSRLNHHWRWFQGGENHWRLRMRLESFARFTNWAFFACRLGDLGNHFS